jgi:hypothetical protein
VFRERGDSGDGRSAGGHLAHLNYLFSFDTRRSTMRRLLEVLEESQSFAYRQEGKTIIVSKAER